ncbi:MAG TPA: hypothetical protein VFC17_15565 [Candidatus Limnocylindrales bacterium]|nr:hypothetical protein [Candidatus Limnocylindrales bacterium]
MFCDETANELLIVTATGKAILAADFCVGLARINFWIIQLRQHAGHEQPHSGAIARAIHNRKNPRRNLFFVNKRMAKVRLCAFQGSFKQFGTILHGYACRCV